MDVSIREVNGFQFCIVTSMLVWLQQVVNTSALQNVKWYRGISFAYSALCSRIVARLLVVKRAAGHAGSSTVQFVGRQDI
jgi:hypothetical protein